MTARRPGSRRIVATLLAAALPVGCDVPEPPRNTGGIDAAAPRTADGGAPCARGIFVIETDYSTANVALLDLDGKVLSPSFASSATASVGLTAPLGSDVVAPTSQQDGSELVLIDRWPAGRLSWADLSGGTIVRTLGVNTGFFSNPHDYVQLSPTRAYVTRFEENPSPGAEPFDVGSDVLVIDPSLPQITGSIDLRPAAGASGALPRPDRIVVVGERAFALLSVLDATFAAAAPSRLAVLDTTRDRLVTTLELVGFRGCSGLAVSPTRDELAVLCSGTIDPTGPGSLDGSGVVIVDIEDAPVVSKSFPAADRFETVPGFFVDYATPDVLVGTTVGYQSTVGPDHADDTAFALDLRTGGVTTLLRWSGEPFFLPGVACDVACGACFIADAGRSVVHRYDVDPDGTFSFDRAIRVETRTGLPPRYLGKF